MPGIQLANEQCLAILAPLQRHSRKRYVQRLWFATRCRKNDVFLIRTQTHDLLPIPRYDRAAQKNIGIQRDRLPAIQRLYKQSQWLSWKAAGHQESLAIGKVS